MATTMPTTFNASGPAAANQYADLFRQYIANDPEIQAVIHSVWGNTTPDERPSDTPKNLEHANDVASKRIAQILASRGIHLPKNTFVNPRSASLEGEHGWAGLSTATKIAIIAALAGGGVGLAAAGGAFAGAGASAAGSAAGGGAGAAGAGAAGLAGGATGVTAGLGSLSGIGTALGAEAAPGIAAGLGAAGAGAAGAGGLLSSTSLAGTAAMPAATGGINSAALLSGAGAAGGTGGGSSLGGSVMSKLLTNKGLATAGQGISSIAAANAHNRGVALDAMMSGDLNKIRADQNEMQQRDAIMKMFQRADYLKNGGPSAVTPQMSASGRNIPVFSSAMPMVTDADKAMASDLETQLMSRLNNPLQLSDYNSKMNPSKTETAMNWLGPALTTAATFYK